MRLIPSAAAFLLFLSASAVFAKDVIVGDWYEDMKQRGMRTISIAHFHADGTFLVEFRKCFPGGVLDTTEAGHWTYTDGKMHLRKEMYNGVPGILFEETYQTTSNNGRIWDYRLISTLVPVSFHDVRVTADSKMPGCDMTS